MIKKIINKIINIVLTVSIIFGMFPPTIVHGATQGLHVRGAEWIGGGIYINKVRPSGGGIAYQQAEFIRIVETGEWAYCIQPGTPIDDTSPYSAYDNNWAMVSGMSQAQWDRVSLLAHYGYSYTENGIDHTDSKWYAITQVLIWKTVAEPLGWRFYFTDTLNGNEVPNKFASEIAELENLVANHYKVPSFNGTNQKVTIGTELKLTDSNGVLNKFKVQSNSVVNATISGNELTITPKAVGKTTLTLTKTDNKWSTPPILYMNPASQNVMVAGYYDPVPTLFNIEVVGGKITINKKDVDLKQSIPQGEAILSGAVYGIYTDTNIRVGTITTDANGKVTSDYLPTLGRFYVLEETPSKGYLLDTTKYYFNITETDLYPEIDVFEKVINRDIEIIKLFAKGDTGQMTPEVNIRFGFFDKSGGLYKEAVTDSKGYLKVNLPFGTYTVKQLTTTPNHEKVQDFIVEVKDIGDPYTYVLSNADTQAKLKVIKVDYETGKTIALSGIKFKIFDIDKNEYVTQKITYPTNQIITEFETDAYGILTTPYSLSSGHYRLEEVDQVINGYLWTIDPIYFEISDTSNFIYDEDFGTLIEVKFSNKQVKGQIDIHKDGEKLVIEDDSFYYETISLKDVEIGLYAEDDIIIYGHKYYSKDELVATLITDEFGNVSIDNLPLGKYYIKELSTVYSHVLDETTYHFELKYKDQYTKVIYQTLNLENKLQKGKLEFTKTDLVTSDPIPNTLIAIFTEDGTKIFEGYTDEDGRIVIDNLFVGKFYIIELETASPNYILNPDPMWFEITQDGEIVKANMTNELIVEVPDTGIADSNILKNIGYLLIIGGIAYVIYDKRKKK